jgi:hypothetical protein
MAFCIYRMVASGSTAQFFALVGDGQPAMYMSLITFGGGPPPAITLTYGTGSCTPLYNEGATTLSSSGENIDVAYTSAPPTAPAPDVGQRFQVTFSLDTGTTQAMIAGTVWGITITGAAGQSFTCVVSDNEVDSFHDDTIPFLSASSAALGPITSSGQSTLQSLNVSGAVGVGGSLSVAGALGVGTTAPAATLDVAGTVRIQGNRLKNASGFGIVETNANDWLRINPDQQYPAVAVFHSMALGDGGLSVGDWSQMPSGQLRVTSDASVGGVLTVGGARIRNASGFGIVETNANDWLRINPDQQYPATAIYNSLAIGTGGLSVGDWSQMPAGQLRVTGNATVGGSLTVHSVVDIEGPAQATPFNVLTVNAASFDVVANLTQSYFITASDLGAARVKFSVRGDGFLTVDGGAAIAGALTSPSKHFLIDHPLDPANMHLVHGCLEGPELGVYYRGEGRLSGGRAVVELPAYFESLTRKEGRTVQLTPRFESGSPPSMLAASSIGEGRFEVRTVDGGNPSQAFFWEVKAARADLPVLETERVKLAAPAVARAEA